MTPFLVTATIDGALPSMKNQRRIVRNSRTGRIMVIKSAEALLYAQSFAIQLPKAARIKYDGPVSLKARVHYPSRRHDLDVEYLKDLLQANGVIVNDRQVIHQEAWAHLDRHHPRVHFTIYPAKEGEDA